MRSAFAQRHRRLSASTNSKYHKNESKITWADIQDCLILVTNNFSTQTSYENQTKKSITNKFVQEAMTDFLKRAAGRSTSSRTPPTRRRSPSRCSSTSAAARHAEKAAAQHQEEAHAAASTSPTGCRNSWTAAPKTSPGGSSISWRATPPWAPCKLEPGRGVPGHHARARQDPQLPEGGLRHASSKARSSPTSSRSWAAAWRCRAQTSQGSGRLRPGQPALEQDRHLHRRRCGRLSRSAR